MVFDLEFFKGRQVNEHWRDHSAALKWYRQEDSRERAFSGNWRKLKNIDPDWRAEIVHPKGMDYSFTDTTMSQYPWLDLIAQLDEPSMQYVVNGEEGRGSGCGVTECWFRPRPGSYDRATAHANRKAGRPNRGSKPIWDFVVFRRDNSGVRLHPQWSTNEVLSFGVEGHTVPVQPPPRGPGESWGRGRYQYDKVLSNQKTLKFANFGLRQRAAA